jgi:hypothetical protein
MQDRILIENHINFLNYLKYNQYPNYLERDIFFGNLMLTYKIPKPNYIYFD